MENMTTIIRDRLQKQLDSYNEYPMNGEFDRGYKSAIQHA